MLPKIIEVIEPHIVEAIFAFIMAHFGWFTRNFFKTRESQRNLHLAIGTGVNYALDAVLSNSSLNKAMEQVTEYVEHSVPDSIRFLKADREQIDRMAVAAISARRLEHNLYTRP